jgi:transposase
MARFVLPTIQAALTTREVLPAEHLVDAGYVTADHLVASQKEHDVILLGPVNPDASWQAKAQQGFDVASFVVDWDTHTVTCPRGRESVL